MAQKQQTDTLDVDGEYVIYEPTNESAWLQSSTIAVLEDNR